MSADTGKATGRDAQNRTAMNGSQLSHVVAMHRLLKASYLITQPFFTDTDAIKTEGGMVAFRGKP